MELSLCWKLVASLTSDAYSVLLKVLLRICSLAERGVQEMFFLKEDFSKECRRLIIARRDRQTLHYSYQCQRLQQLLSEELLPLLKSFLLCYMTLKQEYSTSHSQSLCWFQLSQLAQRQPSHLWELLLPELLKLFHLRGFLEVLDALCQRIGAHQSSELRLCPRL
jgi:hypothetical protein